MQQGLHGAKGYLSRLEISPLYCFRENLSNVLLHILSKDAEVQEGRGFKAGAKTSWDAERSTAYPEIEVLANETMKGAAGE
jgi:hypothetical protein